ncbi:MAG: DUF547 domain-containing protein [Marinirhabdus sp.]
MKPIFKSFALATIALVLQSCNLISAAGLSSQGQPIKKVDGKLSGTTTKSAVTLDHSDWDELLKKHVNAKGLVNYKGFKNDRETLNLYLQKLTAANPTKQWSVHELLAYYINLYNANTVDLILRNYPTMSIQNIKGNFTNGFVAIGGRKLSLGGLENGVLRKMNEPRIHFAVNCASISCPKLLNEAYTAKKINEQLEQVTKNFINSDKNEITPNAPKLSKIFKWYEKDFKVNGKTDVTAFINKYSSTKINPRAQPTYKEYDWSLNEQK